MTCELDRMNPVDALYDRAKLYPGGIEGLALRMRMSSSVLYKKLEHNNATHHLRFDEFVDIVALLAAAGVPDAYTPLRALMWRFDHVAVHLPQLCVVSESDLSRDMVKAVVEVGDIARKIDTAYANDGKIDFAEWKEIDQEIEQGQTALQVLRNKALAIRQPKTRKAKT